MRDIRVFIPAALHVGARLALDERNNHYLLKVLRLKDGERITLFNGDGCDYAATLCLAGKNRAEALVGSARQPESESPLFTSLAIAMSKGERMDYAVQKATELGVNRIVPLHSERVELKLPAERLARKHEHWRQVAVSACEQSGRSAVVEVLQPMPLQQWLALETQALQAGKDPGARMLLHLQGCSFNAFAGKFGALKEATLLVGPEGGFTGAELQFAEASGYTRVCLGNRTMRTETAPVAALALLQSRWGDYS